MTEQDMKNLEAMFQLYVGTYHEDFQSKLDLVVEGYQALHQEMREMRTELKGDIGLCNFKIDTLNTKIDGVEAKLTKKIDGVEEKLSKKIDGVAADLKATDDRLSKKIDGVEAKLTEKIDGVEEKLSKKIDDVAVNLKAHRADTEAHHGMYQVRES